MFAINTSEKAIQNGLNYKKDDSVIIIYDESFEYVPNDEKNQYKSVVFDLKTSEPIATQYNKIICGFKDITDFNATHPYTKLVAKKCYEGTHIIVFYHNDKWYVCTRKCIDASMSFWNPNMSFHTMLTSAMEGKFTFDDLNKEHCYHFNIIHYMNRRSVDYTEELGKKYKEIDLIMVTEKKTMKIIDETLKGVLKIDKMPINDISDIQSHIDVMARKEVSTDVFLKNEGYIIEHYNENGDITLCKIQTPQYEYMYKHTSNTFGMDFPKFDICCQYYSNPCQESCHMVDTIFDDSDIRMTCMLKVAKNYEILADTCNALYFITRKGANPRIYGNLSTAYKNMLYKINGMYLKNVREIKDYRISKTEVMKLLKMCSNKEFKELLVNYARVIEDTHNFNKQSQAEFIYFPCMLF